MKLSLSKLNPFKRTVTHCHIPLISGLVATMDSPGGVVRGLVEHPDDEAAAKGLYIEFVGIVVDTDNEEQYDRFSDVLDEIVVEFGARIKNL